MSVLRRWGVLGLFAAAVWLLPGQARAFPDEPYSLDDGTKAHTKRFHVLGEIGLFAGKRLEGNQRSVIVSPLFELRLQLAYKVLMQVVWGMAYANVDRAGDAPADNTFRFGNPYVVFHYQGKKNQFSYRFGVGGTIPVATLPGDIGDQDATTAQQAYLLAAAIRGNNMFWLWDVHTASVIVPVAVERTKPSGFLWGAYLDSGVLIKINDKNPRTVKAAFIMQMAAMMGYQATDWLRVGSRFSLVWIPKFPEEQTQLAVEPFLRFGHDNAFGAIRLNINIDNPNGFSFDKRQVWGLRIGGGAAF